MITPLQPARQKYWVSGVFARSETAGSGQLALAGGLQAVGERGRVRGRCVADETAADVGGAAGPVGEQWRVAVGDDDRAGRRRTPGERGELRRVDDGDLERADDQRLGRGRGPAGVAGE